LVASAAYGLSKRHAKQYTATASLVFNNQQISQQVAGLQALNNTSSQQAEQNTNLKLVQLGGMAAKTAGVLGHGLTKEKVSGDLSINGQGESNIVVAATATSSVLAAEIANTYTGQFVEEQQNSNHKYYAVALALLEKQLRALSSKERAGTVGLALQDRAQSLGALAELKNGDVQIAQPATVPTSSSSPKVSRNTALGAVLGLLLGLDIAFLLERLDGRSGSRRI
jgi:capsular polysaccharide biosynthesis protein